MSVIEEKKIKPPDKATDYFKCVKIPIKHVLKNPKLYKSGNILVHGLKISCSRYF